jgi:hypothetical protein
MQALRIYAGPKARAHIAANGLRAQDIGVIPGAAGGPKGLILGPLDRFIFGQWLPQSQQPVHLVGASIGAWRMATACLNQSVKAFERLEHDYIHQHYELPPGQKRPSAAQVSREFGQSLQAFYGGRIDEVLHHPRYRLHVVTSHGRHILHREHTLATALGYAGAYLSNAVSRRWMGAWLERVVFSTGGAVQRSLLDDGLPFATDDFRTLLCDLTAENFMPAIQASCSIPFVLQAVHDIPGGPTGAYWDGGITDYHLHWHYAPPQSSPIVLYPHFQQQVVPGWLDKAWKHRHRATPALDAMVLLAPNPEWVRTLPNGKLPDRTDFTRYGMDLAARVAVWNTAASAAQQMADEFAQWLDQGCRVDALHAL